MTIPVILCGGSGKRLWPVSSRTKPKQFHKFFGETSLFQESIIRLDKLSLEKPIIVTSVNFLSLIKEQLEEINADALSIICESQGKNTAPAIITAAISSLTNNQDPKLIVFPSDHIITCDYDFEQTIHQGLECCNELNLITFGIKPDRPETGYGYLEVKKERKKEILGLSVKNFTEKPSIEKAKEFLSSGNYFWNSGIFAFKASSLIREARLHCHGTYKSCKSSINLAEITDNIIYLDPSNYSNCKSDSIDFAIMEKATDVICFPVTSKWLDAGSWNSIWENEDKDDKGNSISGHVHHHNSSGNLLRSENLPLVVSGVKDLLVITSNEGVLISTKEELNKTQELISEHLDCKEAIEVPNDISDSVKKPWGSYKTYDLQDNFQIKSIDVKPGHALSLQSHAYREENWVVVAGEATVEVDSVINELQPGESVFIPIGSKHRLENKGSQELKLIEIQTGTYFGEDDIIRYEDRYGRKD